MMARISGLLLIAGLLVVSLVGCGDFFEFHSPNGSTTNGGNEHTGQAMFFDDFEDGANHAWTAASGTWRAEGGLYSVQEETVIDWLNTYVKTENSKQWRNYAIDVDIQNAQWYQGFNDQYAAIILRAQDDINKVRLHMSGGSLYWQVIVNDDVKTSEGSVSPGLTGQAHLRIEVKGDTYTAYVRQGEEGGLIKRTSFTDETFSHGMPGLAVFYKIGIDFDNFRVTKLEN